MTKILLPALITVLCPIAEAQWTQQGGEIDAIGGVAVAVSSDGNTAVFGNPDQRNGKGQTTVYIRANGNWSQQGGTLIGSGASGNSRQGQSVTISADGNTILVGGGTDVAGGAPAGAAWVFTRSGGVWTQQGNKLVGSGATSTGSEFGFAVALSADGNTALISGPGDGYNAATGLTAGAAWFFTRSGGTWTQQGSKQVPAGNPLFAGVSAALSSDGATAILGSPYDGGADSESYGPGALWVFTRSGSTWSQQGGKLTASGTVGDAALGISVALSSDGSTAIAGASFDNTEQGSAWVFVRNSGVWSQQGGKLFGAGGVGIGGQGQSVAISGDGNTAVIGGPADNLNEGAAWAFRRQSGVWSAFGGKLVGVGDANGNSPDQGMAVAISSDASTLISCGDFGSGGGVAFVFTSGAVGTVNVTLQTSPASLRVSLDGGAFTAAPLTASLATGSNHTIAVQSPQSGGTGTQYVFTGWSDSGAASHSITVGAAPATYTASLKTQYQLTASASPAAGGSVTPVSGGFYDSGTVAPINATANSGFTFANWTGNVASATSASTTVTMSAPQTVTANFSSTSGITIQTNPSGLQFTIDGGSAQTAPRTLNLGAGTHSLAVAATQAGAAGTQYVFTSWSDGGAASHSITVGTASATYTATFKTQYQLTLTASPPAGGSVIPANAAFYDSGSSVPIAATANSGYTFSNWIGSVASPTSASTTVTMSASQVLVAMFSTVTATGGSRFVPVTPCRVVDTRGLTPPVMAANSKRTFTISTSSCPSLPATAKAYSVNVTVVPAGPLSYLTIWPTGQTQPFVSTLNAYDGSIVANAALVPAGTNGSVDVYVTDQTHVIIDINGYFDSQSGQPFFTTTPCRVVDTRGGGLTGAFGTPSMVGNQARSFPVPSSPCGLPSGAAAYSLNATVVPPGTLGYLTAWPAGQPQPVVSTLNAPDGRVVANAAIIPAGTAGAVSVYVTDPTDLILDANGYFASTGTGTPLSFYPVTPCRVVDTRGAAGAFGGPSIGGGASRSFAIPLGACNIPSTAQAYSVNVTAVPPGPLTYLTAWPSGQPQPTVSTLNSFAGKVVANAAIVPAGASGAVSVFVSNLSDVIIDINGYFAP